MKMSLSIDQDGEKVMVSQPESHFLAAHGHTYSHDFSSKQKLEITPQPLDQCQVIL